MHFIILYEMNISYWHWQLLVTNKMHRKSKVTDKGARLKWIGRVHVLPCRGVGSEEKVKWLKNNSKLRLYFSFFNVLYQGTNLLGTYKVSPHWVLWLRQKKLRSELPLPRVQIDREELAIQKRESQRERNWEAEESSQSVYAVVSFIPFHYLKAGEKQT